jgi:hypothetical protein
MGRRLKQPTKFYPIEGDGTTRRATARRNPLIQ